MTLIGLPPISNAICMLREYYRYGYGAEVARQEGERLKKKILDSRNEYAFNNL